MLSDNSPIFNIQKTGRIHQWRADLSGLAAEVSADGQGVKILIWAAAILFFGFGDTFTSLMVFNAGGGEGNLLMRAVLTVFGPTLGSFVTVKMAATVGIVLLSRLLPQREVLMGFGMLMVGVFLVTHNCMVLYNG